MKVRQAMLTHWEVERLLSLLDADPSFGRESLDASQSDSKLYNKLLSLKARFLPRDKLLENAS